MSREPIRFPGIRHIEDPDAGDDYDAYALDAVWTVEQLLDLPFSAIMRGISTVTGLSLLKILVDSGRLFSAMKLLFLRLTATVTRGEGDVDQVVSDIIKVWPMFYGEIVWYLDYLDIEFEDVDRLSMYEYYKIFGESDAGYSRRVREILDGIDKYLERVGTGSRLFDNTTITA